jgi:hypothetical protein
MTANIPLTMDYSTPVSGRNMKSVKESTVPTLIGTFLFLQLMTKVQTTCHQARISHELHYTEEELQLTIFSSLY